MLEKSTAQIVGIVADTFFLTASVALGFCYVAFCFFPGTVLTLLATPWFFLANTGSHEDHGWRKPIFIITSWILTVIGLIYILGLSYNAESGSLTETSTPVKALLITNVVMLIVAVFAQLFRLYISKRTHKNGFARASFSSV